MLYNGERERERESERIKSGNESHPGELIMLVKCTLALNVTVYLNGR